MFLNILPFFASAALALFFIFLFAPVAKRLGLVDLPNERKIHHTSTPLIGGITIFLAIIFPLLLFESVSFSSLRIFVFCSGLMVLIGVLDDLKDIPPSSKFFMQFGIALVLFFFSGTQIIFLGDIFALGQSQGLSSLSLPFTVIAIVGVINSYNMIDGQDGLCGSVTLVSLSSLLFLFIIRSSLNSDLLLQSELVILTTLVIISTAIFLVFNCPFRAVRKHKIFLGDAGSMLLGLVIVFLVISLSNSHPAVLKMAAVPWIIGLPLVDMCNVILVRVIKRKSIFSADRTHFHHVLTDRGFSQLTGTTVLTLFHLALVGVGVGGVLFEIPDWVLFWTMFPVLAGYHIGYRIFTNMMSKSSV